MGIDRLEIVDTKLCILKIFRLILFMYNKKIHIISRSDWDEPHRIRQQLALLLSTHYEVIYHFPGRINNFKSIRSTNPNILFTRFLWLTKWSSLPPISIMNSLLILFHLINKIKKGDVVINFLPELIPIKYIFNPKIISFINDDFSLMAPKITSWWVLFLLKYMSKNSFATLYVSSQLMRKFPGKRKILFQPWDDLKTVNSEGLRKDIILFWGYISIGIDLNFFSSISRQLVDEKLDLKIWIVGPVDPIMSSKLQKLISDCRNVEYYTSRSLDEIPMNRVCLSVLPVSASFKNSEMLEMPNKAPRILSYNVPLLYTGCKLQKYSFFIEYNGSIGDAYYYVESNCKIIKIDIEEYFYNNNSSSRFNLISELL
jgi:hypothetical protein